jgi:hypothetical protein
MQRLSRERQLEYRYGSGLVNGWVVWLVGSVSKMVGLIDGILTVHRGATVAHAKHLRSVQSSRSCGASNQQIAMPDQKRRLCSAHCYRICESQLKESKRSRLGKPRD